MAEFNNKNTNKKPYAKSGSNDNRRGSYDKKPNYSGDKNVKEFKKNYSDSDKDYKKPYAGKKPVQQKPATPAPVRRPRGVEAPDFAGEVIEYKMSAAGLEELKKAKRYMPNEKKKLSVVLRRLKSCTDYAIVACAELKKFPSNACLPQRCRT